jgi:hypothetical protein
MIHRLRIPVPLIPYAWRRDLILNPACPITVKVTVQRDPSGYALWANPTYGLRLFIVRGGAGP